MGEIKTILNFFDKNNGLDNIIKDLKEGDAVVFLIQRGSNTRYVAVEIEKEK